MRLENYKIRHIDKKIEIYLKTFGAVLIEGPKWCGKTWTSRYHANSEFLLADWKGNFNNKKIAQINPALVLSGKHPRLIDEWQEVPSIWDAVRSKIDETNDKGAFILTGSATINKDRYIHSGAGRIARLKMRPMTLAESGNSDCKVSLNDICNGDVTDLFLGDVELDRIIKLILIGGWPGSAGMDEKQGLLVSREYVKSILNEDIYKIDDVKRDKNKMELLLKSLARNESTTATNKTLQKDIKDKDRDDINVDTISEYLNIINRLYLVENIPPFSSNIRSSLRLKQSEKHHFVDPSLPCALLNLNKQKLMANLELLGFLFESLVLRDLLSYCETFNGKLYHYQDYNNKEIDAVIELEDGSWCAIEIKLGAHQIEEAAKNLVNINESIKREGGKPAKSLCIICGLTNAAYKRPDGVYVVPITSLKD